MSCTAIIIIIIIIIITIIIISFLMHRLVYVIGLNFSLDSLMGNSHTGQFVKNSI